MSEKVKRYRYLALVSHVLLLVWMSVWYLALDTKADYSLAFILLLYIVPLMLPLWGIIKAKPYTHAWACFIILFYFLHAITVMYAEPDYLLHASLELVLATGMFTGCMMYARLRGQELGSNLPKLSKVMEDEKAHFERRDQ
jgi:uncharacterized membrane protein